MPGPGSGALQRLTDSLQAAFEAERKRGEVINIVDQTDASKQRLDKAVRAALDEFMAAEDGGFPAAAGYLHFEGEGPYTRNLVIETPDFELMVLCWKPGQGSRVHNHGKSHGWVTVLAGKVEETRYANPTPGNWDPSAPASPAKAPAPLPALPGVLSASSPCPELPCIGKVVGGPGAQLYINDLVALHAVRCADETDLEEGAVTLHLYAPPVKRVLLYEPEQDRVVTRVPGLFSRGGVRCQ